MAGYRGKPFRSLFLDTFDRLSAPVEHRYVWEELAPWFAEQGLTVHEPRNHAARAGEAQRADVPVEGTFELGALRRPGFVGAD